MDAELQIKASCLLSWRTLSQVTAIFEVENWQSEQT